MKGRERPSQEEVEAAFNDHFRELKGVEKNKSKPKRKSRKVTSRTPPTESPIVTYVHSLGYLTTGEVAEQLGVSKSFVRKLSKARVTQAPSYLVPFGDSNLSLYTEEDVEALRGYINSKRRVMKREEIERAHRPAREAEAEGANPKENDPDL